MPLLDLRRAVDAGLFKVIAMALLLCRVLRAEAETRRIAGITAAETPAVATLALAVAASNGVVGEGCIRCGLA